MVVRWQDYVEERKDVMMGKPVFKGTRLTVEHVLQEMGAGMTDAELLENYPSLRPEHLRAALLYAAAVLAMDEVEGGREVEVTLRTRPLPGPPPGWKPGSPETAAGMMADCWTDEDDRILEEIHRERKRDARREIVG